MPASVLTSLARLTCVLVAVTHVAEGKMCRLPDEWQGRWFQSRMADLVIHEQAMGDFGLCVENKKSYYLFEYGSPTTYTCLWIISRHPNILQYRSRRFQKKSNFRHMCFMGITPDTPLHTLIRDNAPHEPCPFHGTFSMTYNTTSGECSLPLSRITPCAGESLVQMNFRRCPSTPETYDREVVMECLASWKAGASYFYVRYVNEDGLTKDQRHRCFVYEKFDQDYRLAMSADASCRGLSSWKDGPLIMHWQADNIEERDGCSFPSWLGNDTLVDVHGKHKFETKTQSGKPSPSILYRSQVHDQQSDGVMSFKCLHSSRGDRDAFVAITETHHGCTSYYQCISVRHVAEAGAIVLSQGKQSSSLLGSCHNTNWNLTRTLLVADAKSSISCPLRGIYTEAAVEDGTCPTRIRFGCSGESTMQIEEDFCHGGSGYIIQCISSWQENQSRILIATDHRAHYGYEVTPLMTCLSLMESEDGIEFVQNPLCEAQMHQDSTRLFLTGKRLHYSGGCWDKNEVVMEDLQQGANQTSAVACMEIPLLLLALHLTTCIAYQLQTA